jgi:hypothetical protein
MAAPPIATPTPTADGSPAVPTEPMPSFIGSSERFDRPKLPALRKPPPRFGPSPIQVGWLALTGFVALLAVVLTVFPTSVMAAWPATQRLYALFGVNAIGPGDWFTLHINTSTETTDGQKSLMVSGEIANVTNETRSVPKLRVNLLDASSKVVKTWDLQPTIEPLKPGQSVPFQTTVVAPPEDTASVNVTWLIE